MPKRFPRLKLQGVDLIFLRISFIKFEKILQNFNRNNNTVRVRIPDNSGTQIVETSPVTQMLPFQNGGQKWH